MATDTNPMVSARVVRATFSNISDMTLYRWVQQGILPPPVKISGRNYWRESDVEALKQGRRQRSEGRAA
jgi:predicted DNA-binding transcriptional regulator AlpA